MQPNNIIHKLVEQDGIESVDLSQVGEINPDILNLIPEHIAIKYKLIPFSREGDSIAITMANPYDIVAQNAVRAKTSLKPRCYFTSEDQLEEWISKLYYQNETLIEEIEDAMEVGIEVEEEAQEEVSLEVLKVKAQDAPAIRYVNYILLKAIQERASDIHIEPQEADLRIRFRIDGALRQIASPPKKLQSGIISRIKILASLDIAERRIPQDGRCKVRLLGRSVDFRISTLPTIYGEKLVLRILDKASHSLSIQDIGFDQAMLERFKQVLKEPHGIILVTGPTGSGKTTTLYSALSFINSEEKNIITIEDPIEYRLKGINQIQARAQVGLTFAAGLRSILRQDPDVVMVGEIRDLETAEIAIRAALTGHLVFSTLHTNSSIATIMRLVDMGIDKYLICSSILLIVAQRLVRRICLHCAEAYNLDAAMVHRIEDEVRHLKIRNFRRGRGCKRCGGTGYWGRVAVYEFLFLNNALRELILQSASLNQIAQKAKELGMETLWTNGLKMVCTGITTIEEILKVTPTSDSF
ncbi:MAG: GspE/PulE family protein [bacterium]